MEVPRLHPDTVEEVKQRVDIVDVISEHIVLRKRGKDYLGLCPFHDEKTPSFSVSPSKQLYYCFGCNAGGNAFSFLMELGKQSFSDVVFELARRYQVPLKTLEPEQRQELQRQLTLREQLYEILAVGANFYQHALGQPQGEVALDYLRSQRHLDETTISQFGLGYAPAGWETLYHYLVEQKRYPVNLVEQTGLIKKRKSGNGFYDCFRDRLIIPIADSQGKTIGFGSRTLGTEEPKYLNSSQTPLFDKSKTLFALDRAKNAISKEDRAVVVEGYFDAIALHAAGITNTVASLGTALSQAQLKQLLRYTNSKQIIFNFDADRAGIAATERAIREIEPLVYSDQVKLRVLNLPGGKDADEFLQTAPDAEQQYRQRVETAPLWFDWQLEQLLAGQNLKQGDQFQQVSAKIVKLLSKIDNKEVRTYYIARCAELLSPEDAQSRRNYEEQLKVQTRKRQSVKPQAKNNRPQERNRPVQPLSISGQYAQLEQAEALLLRLYLHCPETRGEIIEALEAKDLLFSLSHHRFLWQQIIALESEAIDVKTDPSTLLARLHERSLQFPEAVTTVAHLFYLDEKTEEDVIRTSLLIQAAIASLEQVTYEKRKHYCYQQWQKLDPDTEPERWQYYYQEYYQAKRKIIELEAQRQFSRGEILGSN